MLPTMHAENDDASFAPPAKAGARGVDAGVLRRYQTGGIVGVGIQLHPNLYLIDSTLSEGALRCACFIKQKNGNRWDAACFSLAPYLQLTL
jgi:hypothetical protein